MFNLFPKERLTRDTKLAPYDEMRKMLSLMDNFYDTSLVPADIDYNPIKTDIRETDTEYLIDADLPGIKKDNVKVEYKNKFLVISVEQKEEKEEKEGTYLRKERKFESAERSIFLDNVKEDRISAKFDHGVLKITLPKEKPDIHKNVKIDIQ